MDLNILKNTISLISKDYLESKVRDINSKGHNYAKAKMNITFESGDDAPEVDLYLYYGEDAYHPDNKSIYQHCGKLTDERFNFKFFDFARNCQAVKPIDEANEDNFRNDLAKLIEKGKKFGFNLEEDTTRAAVLSQLEQTLKQMSENVLEHAAE